MVTCNFSTEQMSYRATTIATNRHILPLVPRLALRRLSPLSSHPPHTVPRYTVQRSSNHKMEPSSSEAIAASSSSSSSSTSSSASSTPRRILSLNVGLLGHVDSGKTSLAKSLSTLLSTSALDKLPQSQSRGITIDLGFSAFYMSPPPHLQSEYSAVQVTLVDCPGHASLIRTIIGGAGIIDMMLLVIDVTKGIQTQTAECIIIGEVLTDRIIVVLNKVDLLTDREKQLPKITKQLRAVFAQTKFGKDVTMVATSANPHSKDDLKIKDGTSGAKATAAAAAASKSVSESIDEMKIADEFKPDISELLAALSSQLVVPRRDSLVSSSSSSSVSTPPPFLFAVDHGFLIKGQGTVLTGTVLSGSVKLNQMVELAGLKIERKVKSMQMFRQPVDVAVQGDRLGICVTQLDANLIERGLLCTPGSVRTYDSVIAVVDKIRFFKGPVANKAKFHVSIGHGTAMATVQFFGGPLPSYASTTASAPASAASASSSAAPSAPLPPTPIPPPQSFDWSLDYPWRDELLAVSASVAPHTQYALLEFSTPVHAPLQSLLLGSRLDADVHSNSCRIAFQGRLLCDAGWINNASAASDAVSIAAAASSRARLKVYKLKSKSGIIDRVVDERTIICRDMFDANADMSRYVGMKVELDKGQRGVIEGQFGQGGKFKCYFQDGWAEKGEGASASASASSASASSAAPVEGKGKKNKQPTLKGAVHLRYKKYMYAISNKEMLQD